MARRTGDWIALLEAGYSLDGDDPAWLARLAECAARQHWQDRVSVAFTFDLGATGLTMKDLHVHGPPEVHAHVRAAMQGASAQGIDLLYRGKVVVGTMSELIFSQLPDDQAMFREATAGTVADALGVIAHSGTGRGVVLNNVLDAPRNTTPAERRRWTRCAAHIGAALRLRALAHRLSLDAAPVEAIFDGGGKLHDARDGAAGKTARETLRQAVRRVDQARSSAGRRDADASLAAWEALVSGRWSLIDRFDSDGRRFVVAVRNDPQHPDPRGLSARERQVADYVGLGRSAKEIGYLLGVPAASVENSTRRAQAKLGIGSRVELTAFFSPHGVRARLAQVALAGDELMVGTSPLLDASHLTSLTVAEREVLALLIAGSTDRDIARRRATHVRTVAHQVQAFFRKFGVHSRCELVAHLHAKLGGGALEIDPVRQGSRRPLSKP